MHPNPLPAICHRTNLKRLLSWFVQETVLGVWKQDDDNPNSRGIRISPNKAAKWPESCYLFVLPDDPVVYETNADDVEMFVEDGPSNNDSNHGLYQDEDDQGPDPL